MRDTRHDLWGSPRSRVAVGADGVAHARLKVTLEQVAFRHIEVRHRGVAESCREAAPCRPGEAKVLTHVYGPDALLLEHTYQVVQLLVPHAPLKVLDGKDLPKGMIAAAVWWEVVVGAVAVMGVVGVDGALAGGGWVVVVLVVMVVAVV